MLFYNWIVQNQDQNKVHTSHLVFVLLNYELPVLCPLLKILIYFSSFLLMFLTVMDDHCHIHYFIQGLSKQWHSKFIISSSLINCNFSKKITFPSSIICYSWRYSLQREGRKKNAWVFPFIYQFSECWIELLAFCKVTDLLGVLQTHRIATSFSLVEVQERWLGVFGCSVLGERRYSRFSLHTSAPALELFLQEEPFPSNG